MSDSRIKGTNAKITLPVSLALPSILALTGRLAGGLEEGGVDLKDLEEGDLDFEDGEEDGLEKLS